jgi:hypothetical protein
MFGGVGPGHGNRGASVARARRIGMILAEAAIEPCGFSQACAENREYLPLACRRNNYN